MQHKKRRFSVTLIEMIIVMLLIAAITGALAYNYKDALSEGKAFKTKQSITRIETILLMHAYEHPDDISDIQNKWKDIVASSSLGSGSKDLLRDGWNKEYVVTVSKTDSGDPSIHVKSTALELFNKRHHTGVTNK